MRRVKGLVDVTDEMEQPSKGNRSLSCIAAIVPHHALVLRQRGQDVHLFGFSCLHVVRLPLGFEWKVDVVPGRSVLSLVPGANIVGPSCRLHKDNEAVIGGRNILKSPLPLVRVPRVFL